MELPKIIDWYKKNKIKKLNFDAKNFCFSFILNYNNGKYLIGQ